MAVSCYVLQSLDVGECLRVGLVAQCAEGAWRDQIFGEEVLFEEQQGIAWVVLEAAGYFVKVVREVAAVEVGCSPTGSGFDREGRTVE